MNINVKENKNTQDIDFDSMDGRGCQFLLVPVYIGNVFSSELFNEQQNLFKKAAMEYAFEGILPTSDKLNKELDEKSSKKIFKEMGELGFLGVDIPEEYGGLALDKTTACIVVDQLTAGQNTSMIVTMSAHTGIATLPIVWYGNDSQKKKYLPKMASGEWMGCFALTEPNAGSDAVSGLSSAIESEDGKSYILNGQKIYITNGSWSDVFVTFANVDNKMTAFIIDKECEGLKVGAEENKMGIKGSSTATIYFEDCKVPRENVLGKVGDGNAIAFNVLYTGRYKLGATTASGSKYIISEALKFALERIQFGRPISEFGMIQNKFSNMIVKAWEADSLVYMTSGSIDRSINKLDKKDENYMEGVQKAIEDHGVEASICKVVCSEALAYCADEGVQILGGAGFIEDYKMAAVYRDERINRIFEGTNEINRLLISSLVLKKAILEDIPIRDMIALRKNKWFLEEDEKNKNLLQESMVAEFMRSAGLELIHFLILEHGQDLKNKQWILEPLSNLVIALAIVDTVIKRFKNIKDKIKKNDSLFVIRLSVHNQYIQFMNQFQYILSNYNNKELQEKLIFWNDKLNYKPKPIKYKKKIIERFYEMKKYYLD